MANLTIPFELKAEKAHLMYKADDLTIMQSDNFSICSLITSPHKVTALNAAINAAFNLPLPAPGHISHTQQITALGLGDSQWLIEKPAIQDDHFDVALSSALGENAAITLQSDAWARFDIMGAQTTKVFQRLLPIDLSLSAFPQGRCARSSMHHINCIITHAPQTQQIYRFYCARSYTQSFFHALSDTAKHVAALEEM